MFHRSLVVSASVTLLIACSSSTGSGSSSGSASAAQACADTADAVAKAFQRCGQDYQASYDGFVKAATGGTCSNVVSIRDEASLRETCIPSLNNASCADLNAGKLDDSCRGQLQHPASFQPTLEGASFGAVMSGE
jgi:hypothetical protein